MNIARTTLGPVTSLAVLSLALWSGLFWPVPAAGQSLAEHTMTAPQARALVEAGQAVLVDIRQPEEWRETGMAQGALGISMLHPDGGPGFLSDLNLAVEDQSDATIILICRTGNRTGQVLRALREWGFSEVYHVPEGMIGSRFGPGWIPGGLPIEPCRSC